MKDFIFLTVLEHDPKQTELLWVWVPPGPRDCRWDTLGRRRPRWRCNCQLEHPTHYRTTHKSKRSSQKTQTKRTKHQNTHRDTFSVVSSWRLLLFKDIVRPHSVVRRHQKSSEAVLRQSSRPYLQQLVTEYFNVVSQYAEQEAAEQQCTTGKKNKKNSLRLGERYP